MAYPDPAIAMKGFYVEFADGSTSRIFPDSYGGRADFAEYVKCCRAEGKLQFDNAATVEWLILWDESPSMANQFITGGRVVDTSTYRPRFAHYFNDTSSSDKLWSADYDIYGELVKPKHKEITLGTLGELWSCEYGGYDYEISGRDGGADELVVD